MEDFQEVGSRRVQKPKQAYQPKHRGGRGGNRGGQAAASTGTNNGDVRMSSPQTELPRPKSTRGRGGDNAKTREIASASTAAT